MTHKLGIDIGGTKMLVCCWTGSELKTWRFATGLEFGPEELAENLRGVRRELDDDEIVAGIAVPGLVDSDSTVIACDVLPKLAGWNPVRDGVGLLPRAVLNDGDAALVAVTDGMAADATVAAVGAGTGIAAALQVGGMRLRRFRPFAGELGYVPFGMDGKLDDHAAGSALLKKLGMQAEQITAGLAAGDRNVMEAVRVAGEALGVALATLVNLVHDSVFWDALLLRLL
ncbi:MAG: ROK family protein [Acidobacteria bacterium]|nr:ROK family protein [Acidobacteriota bacterium]